MQIKWRAGKKKRQQRQINSQLLSTELA